MPMRVKTKDQTPYGGGFYINQPEKGLVGGGSTFDRLDASARQWRQSNGWPVGLEFEDELERAICALYPHECHGVDSRLPATRRLHLEDVINGTKVILALKLSGGVLVSREEAQRRWEICSRCKMAVDPPRPCGTLCGELKTIVDALVGGEPMPFDGDTRSCAICACMIAAHVRVPYPILERGISEKMKDEFAAAKELYGCWKTPAG